MTPAEQGASVRVEDGMCVIRLPLSEVHGLRVALAECPCKAAKSIATADVRQRLAKALGRITTNPFHKEHQR